MTRRMTILPTSAPIRKSTKNPYQQITDFYRNSSANSLKTQLNNTDHIQNLTSFMQNTRRSSFVVTEISSQISFSADLEELKCLFDFPEEVAIRLTEIEHEIFLSIPPLQYLRHLTLDTPIDASTHGKSIRVLVQRFQAVRTFSTVESLSFDFCSGWIIYSTINCFTNEFSRTKSHGCFDYSLCYNMLVHRKF